MLTLRLTTYLQPLALPTHDLPTRHRHVKDEQLTVPTARVRELKRTKCRLHAATKRIHRRSRDQEVQLRAHDSADSARRLGCRFRTTDA